MDKFLVMYRSTTTGVSPAGLLFRSLNRTKLPHLQEFSIEDEVRDRDSERKEKGKVYADCQRNERESEIRGDNSLLSLLFRRMAIVFLLRLMVCSTAGM